VSAVLAERADVRLEDVAPSLPAVTDAAGPLPGTLQLWPHRHGTDAMFLALLRRA
ncbi:MAG: rRNA (cytosine967-C5)-methyltransferase, partial [Kribbellaceae bacterium]|nr:rRNA (cytosine967-C5)-methyltransferase [Kribbellaceae bacterium]